jgi:hypothetical protein
MPENTTMDTPFLVVTNPVWLKMFRLGWEDPNWGKRTIDQHAIALAIHEISSLITDEATRTELQRASSKMLLATSQRMIEESGSPAAKA